MKHVIYSLSFSLALNVMAIFSLDRVILHEDRRYLIVQRQNLQKANQEKMFFEFVETPRGTVPQKPVRARKISDRDSVARDLSKNKSGEGGAPKVEKKGPADQLAQIQMKSIQRRAALSKPQKEIKRIPSPPQEEKKAETKNKAIEPAEKKEKKAADEGITQLLKTPSTAENRTKTEQQAVMRQNERQALMQKKQPASAPAEGQKKEISGLDRITTQETSKQKSKGAALYGTTSYDAMGGDMGIYMKKLKEKIWLAWFPYLAFKYPTDYQAADAIIVFTLNPKGEVKTIQCLDSYGSPEFVTFCTNVIQRSSGFGPVPKEILAIVGKDELEIRFAFHLR